MPSVPAPPPAATTLFEHLLAWVLANAPLYVLFRQWSDDPRAGLASYLRSGGALEAIGYNIATRGRDLVRDTVTYVLRPWLETLIAGPARVCFLDRDPGTGQPRPVGVAQLRDLIPADHLLSIGTLAPLLQGIYEGRLDFGGERHRVVVLVSRPTTRGEAIELLLDQGARLGRGGLSQTVFCQRVVDLCDVARDSAGFRDSTILHDAYGRSASRVLCAGPA